MLTISHVRICWTVLLTLAFCSQDLFAHPGHGPLDSATHAGAFQAGWQHPLSGVDHVLAMVAVGLLAFRAGGNRRWLLPMAFLGSMLLGGMASGLPLPGVEFGIAASVLVLGLLVAMTRVAPPQVAIGLVMVFALFHGHAHTAEMMAGMSLPLYAVGFLLSTTLLLATGVAAGVALEKLNGARVVRFAGGTIAVAGLMLVVALV
ncbi:HupE/UreJ family protein [Planctomicrobium sp. SH527]|uniref:HupE/UreJ family protein n=1 Tax=Planctomicrobium sp. SH527 TaxID=3448123 RepID=UPI003F5BE668